MNVATILAELRQERDQIEEAILRMEQLARSSGRKRGGPPAWLANPPRKRGRPLGSKNKSNKTYAKSGAE
jgi:hypothetical protein